MSGRERRREKGREQKKERVGRKLSGFKKSYRIKIEQGEGAEMEGRKGGGGSEGMRGNGSRW